MRTRLVALAAMVASLVIAPQGAPPAGAVGATSPVVGIAATTDGNGYWTVAADGSITAYGDATYFGGANALALVRPIVGMAAQPKGTGYWLVASDGGIFGFGDALFLGSTGGMVLNRPVVGMATTFSGLGYWLVAADGGIFSFGDASFFGSTGSLALNQPVVGMTATSDAMGYWLVAADGGIFSFGNAAFHGSMGSTPLVSPVSAMSATPNGNGYRMIAGDGGVFSFGAPFYGRPTGGARARSIANRPLGDGYWVVQEDGTVTAYGSAQVLPVSPTQPAALAAIMLHTTPFVTGLASPTAMGTRPGDATAFYVTERPGRVRRANSGVLDSMAVLDISSQVSTGGERGLLGLAFSSNGSKLYVDYTDLNGDINVVEYSMTGNSAASPRTLLTIGHSTYSNHNGGDLERGPDGMLYISVGDGGSGGDPFRSAQDLNSLLGKILRINPTVGSPYGIPVGNPYANRPNAKPEVWDYGLRNPWRISFDRANGDLWIGDVGQALYEEIDHEAANSGGHNYGWSIMEGTHPYYGGALPTDYLGPVLDYTHNPDCSVTGGRVYRGSAITPLFGTYLYSDFCGGRLAGVRLTAGGGVADQRASFLTVSQPVSFGEDQAGELYIVSLTGTIYKITP